MTIFGTELLDLVSDRAGTLKDGSRITEHTKFDVSEDEMAVLYDTDNEVLYNRMKKKYKLDSTLDLSLSGANLITGLAIFFAEIPIVAGIVVPMIRSGMFGDMPFSALALAAAAVGVPAIAIFFFFSHLKYKSELKKAIDEGSYYVYNCKVENKTTRHVRSRHNSKTYYYLILGGAMVNVKNALFVASGIGGVVRCVIVQGEKNKYLLVIDN